MARNIHEILTDGFDTFRFGGDESTIVKMSAEWHTFEIDVRIGHACMVFYAKTIDGARDAYRSLRAMSRSGRDVTACIQNRATGEYVFNGVVS